MKKGQVSSFVIIGFIVIFIISMIFWFYSEYQKDIVRVSASDVSTFKRTKETVQNYIQQCLEVTVLDMKTQLYIIEIDMIPDYVDKNFLDCIDDFTLFREQGYEFVYDFPNTYVEQSNGRWFIDLTFPVTMTRYDDETKFDSFNYDVDIFQGKEVPEGYIMIYRNVIYREDTRDDPRQLNIFIIKVDVDDPAIKFFVTPKINGIKKTSKFMQDNNLQIALNGGSYNNTGNLEVRAFSASQGVVYSDSKYKVSSETIFFSKDSKITFGSRRPSKIYNALNGFQRLVVDGQVKDRFYKGNPGHKPGYDYLNPATSYGYDESENQLILAVIDGRNPGVSEGVSKSEVGEIMIEFDADQALNMDGGGSSTIVTDNMGVINNPSDGSERAVANHLGVWAKEI